MKDYANLEKAVPSVSTGVEPGVSSKTKPLQIKKVDKISDNFSRAGISVSQVGLNTLTAKEAKKMFDDMTTTAWVKGSKGYAMCFGGVGVAGRAIAAGIDYAVDAGALEADLVVKTGQMATSMLMSATHTKAGLVSAKQWPGEKPMTTCVQRDPANPVPLKNLALKATKPFIHYLAAGNTAVNVAGHATRLLVESQSAGQGEATASGISANSTLPGVSSSPNATFTELSTVQETGGNVPWGIGKWVETAINVFGPYVPGQAAAMETGKDFLSGQLALGMSLSQPLPPSSPENDGGVIVTHQQPLQLENGQKEVGYLTVPDGATIHKLSVRDASGELCVDLSSTAAPEPEEKTGLDKAKEFAAHLLPDRVTLMKNVSMASTLTTIAGIKWGIVPMFRDGLIANGVDPKVAAEGSKALGYTLANERSGMEFMNKWASATEQPKTWKESICNFLGAAIPFWGGAISLGQTPMPSIPGLSEEQFQNLAENKVAMMSALSPFTGAIKLEDELTTVDTPELLNFVRSQQSARGHSPTEPGFDNAGFEIDDTPSPRPSLSSRQSIFNDTHAASYFQQSLSRSGSDRRPAEEIGLEVLGGNAGEFGQAHTADVEVEAEIHAPVVSGDTSAASNSLSSAPDTPSAGSGSRPASASSTDSFQFQSVNELTGGRLTRNASSVSQTGPADKAQPPSQRRSIADFRQGLADRGTQEHAPSGRSHSASEVGMMPQRRETPGIAVPGNRPLPAAEAPGSPAPSLLDPLQAAGGSLLGSMRSVTSSSDKSESSSDENTLRATERQSADSDASSSARSSLRTE